MSKVITTGQDSFLDIVANLVGILIILVVAVSAQATHALSKPKPTTELVEQVAVLEDELTDVTYLLTKLEIDNEELEQRMIRENQLAADLTDQRHDMLIQLEIVKLEMEKERERRLAEDNAIDAKQKTDAKKRAELAVQKKLLEDELVEIAREANAVAASSEPKSEVIEHFPNPIAKTVFSEEVHFRLADGKLSYVPMDELIARMKTEWQAKAEKLQQANRTVETIGPIGNYRMQYELVAQQSMQDTPYGPVEARSVQFKRFHIFPRPGGFGESVDGALAVGSQFLAVLNQHEPRKTTVSIWVYPDSYAEHNQIKSWLHEHGFQMASWPLDFGRSISGGPQGFRTSAQ